MSDVPLPSWLFSWKNTHIYIYIHWFPLEKLKVFMLQRISWDWGKEPFLAVSTELFFTLRGVPPANACASRHTGNLKPYALSFWLLPVTGGAGFGRDSMVVGNLELWNLLLVVVLICSNIRWLNCYVVISLKKIPRNWVNWTNWVETT